jgi:hypothetical protein
MRSLIVVPIVALAACGGGAPEQNNMAASAPPAAIAPGLWTLQSEVTTFALTDPPGPPAIDTPAGTRATETVCVGPGETPPPELFGGAGNDCHGNSIYARNGRLSVQMICTRAGLSGNIMVGVDGSFTGDGIEYERDVRTNLATDGDVQMTLHVTGRRGGDCTPGAQAGGNAGAPAGNGA